MNQDYTDNTQQQNISDAATAPLHLPGEKPFDNRLPVLTQQQDSSDGSDISDTKTARLYLPNDASMPVLIHEPQELQASTPPSAPVVQPTASFIVQSTPSLGVARVVTVGVGGAGTNAINHMIQVGVSGVEFIAMNTDAQALELARAPKRLRLGETLTRGLGAGGNPQIGQQAAQESYDTIREHLRGAHMVFITAGMGGGTGTGASPLVARAAHAEGALTVAVVTTPFAFERRRKQIAADGVAKLREMVDALIMVPNERLMELHPQDLSAFEAYRLADEVLRQGIQGISDLITVPGLINLDFADIQAVMKNTGSAWLAMSRASGGQRAEDAAHAALSNPLLNVDMSSARSVIFNITAGDDLKMAEVHQIAEILAGAVHPEANIIFGTVHDPTLTGTIKLTVVATGFEQQTVAPNFRAAAHPVQFEPRVPARRQKAFTAQTGLDASWPEKQPPPWAVQQANTSSTAPNLSEPPTPRAARRTIPLAVQDDQSNAGQKHRPPAEESLWAETVEPRVLSSGRKMSRRPLPPSLGTSDEELRMRRLEELRMQRERAMSAGQQEKHEDEEEYVAGDDDVPSRPPWKRLFGRH